MKTEKTGRYGYGYVTQGNNDENTWNEIFNWIGLEASGVWSSGRLYQVLYHSFVFILFLLYWGNEYDEVVTTFGVSLVPYIPPNKPCPEGVLRDVIEKKFFGWFVTCIAYVQ